MKLEILKSKIHRATVTDANLDYVGSLSLDPLLMKAANLNEYEKMGFHRFKMIEPFAEVRRYAADSV